MVNGHAFGLVCASTWDNNIFLKWDCHFKHMTSQFHNSFP